MILRATNFPRTLSVANPKSLERSRRRPISTTCMRSAWGDQIDLSPLFSPLTLCRPALHAQVIERGTRGDHDCALVEGAVLAEERRTASLLAQAGAALGSGRSSQRSRRR